MAGEAGPAELGRGGAGGVGERPGQHDVLEEAEVEVLAHLFQHCWIVTINEDVGLEIDSVEIVE